MVKTKVNWTKVWRDFNKWFEAAEKGNIPYGSPEWKSQQLQIRKLVEHQLRKQ